MTSMPPNKVGRANGDEPFTFGVLSDASGGSSPSLTFVVSPRMKKIGTTTTGSVIVEMTTQEYDALQQLQVGGTTPAAKVAADHEVAPRMNHSERSAYVAERLRKLSPKKKDGVIRSIEAMFQFGGGIESPEVEKVIATLQKQKFFSIAPDGRVTYTKG